MNAALLGANPTVVNTSANPNAPNRFKTIVRWSPHQSNVFAIGGGDDLRLCETIHIDPDASDISDWELASSTPTTTQRKRSFRLVQVNADLPQLKCFEWYPHANYPLMHAVGLASGKLVLTNFHSTQQNHEYAPKYSRPCNALSWNKSNSQQIAVGLEKVRSDFCTLVWDVEYASSSALGIGSGGNASTGVSGSINGATITASGVSGTDSSQTPTKMSRPVSPLSKSVSHSNLSSLRGRMGSDATALGSSGTPNLSASTVMTSFNLGNSSVRSAPRDRWIKPLHELANSEATVALSWVPSQPFCLATGTGFKWLRIYDLRSSTAPLSVVAHAKGVYGVVFDNHRPHLLATYCDAAQEVVKIWDIRKLDGSGGPIASVQPTSKTLSDIAWSPLKAGILATTSVEEKWISLWDVNSAMDQQDYSPSNISTVRKPFRRRYISEPAVSFSWQRSASTDPDKSSDASLELCEAFPNRLLIGSSGGDIHELSFYESMPLSISAQGALAFGYGKIAFGESLKASSKAGVEDVSFEMHRLAQAGYSMKLKININLCQAAAQNENIGICIDESISGFTSPLATWRHRQILEAWKWIEEMDQLRREKLRVTLQEGSSTRPSKLGTGFLEGWPDQIDLLVDAGIRKLLQMHPDPSRGTYTESISRMDPTLLCPIYEGRGRRFALRACKWDPDNSLNLHNEKLKIDLEAFKKALKDETQQPRLDLRMMKCIVDRDYGKAAALAVFHGDLRSAVTVLQFGAKELLAQNEEFLSSESMAISKSSYETYVNTIQLRSKQAAAMQLVAMAIAGFSAAVAPDRSSSQPFTSNQPRHPFRTDASSLLWIDMCKDVMKRSEIQDTSTPRYLHAVCVFLLSCLPKRMQSTSSRKNLTRRESGNVSDSSASYDEILLDASLPLSDRVAFACRFLSASELESFIKGVSQEAEQNGVLEGLLVLGIGTRGIKLLQRYIDLTGDIQTASLMVARLPRAYISQQERLDFWIDNYRQLLNQRRLWRERAKLDVGMSEMEDHRLRNSQLLEKSISTKDTDRTAPSTSIEPKIPPQLYVRCNYCGASLSLASMLRLGTSQANWLTRANPKLTCCPSCRKPLPQCSLCLLPFGALNPYFELASRRARQKSEALADSVFQPSLNVDGVFKDGCGVSDLSTIPFAEWFTWCQTCRHGGHAHHIQEWFESHTICPVSECNCHCLQLDDSIGAIPRKHITA